MSDIIYNQYLATFATLRRRMQAGGCTALKDELASLHSSLGRKLSSIAQRDAALTASPKTRLELLLELLDSHPE